jgi:signal transduction histidine kinase
MIESTNFHIQGIHVASEQARQRNEELVVATQMAEEAESKKTDFIQTIYHQIRTPLNIVMGFAQVLRNSVSEGEDMPEEEKNNISRMMCRNASILNRMLLMLYDTSDTALAHELSNNKNVKVSCNEIARESIEYTKKHFQGLKVLFTTDLSDGVQILTNHLYLMRTIRELLYNAAKYSDGEHIHLHVSETDTTVNFTIEDTGSGLPDDADDLLYKPFIKIDDLSEGLGLGLPLCKRHALSLGGDLIYDRDYRDGSRLIPEMPK